MLTDIEIAQQAKMKKIREVAEEIGISTDLPGELLAMFRKDNRERLASMMLAKRCADRLLEKECMEERLLSMNDRQTERNLLLSSIWAACSHIP